MKFLKGVALAVTLFLATYVAYAHVSSWLKMPEYLENASVENFDSRVGLEKSFEVRSEGDIRYAVEGNDLHVTGQTGGASELSRLQFVGPLRRLRELQLTMRYRVHDESPYDLMMGLESPEGQPTSNKEFRFGLSNGPSGHAVYKMFGSERPGGSSGLQPSQMSENRPADGTAEWHEVRVHVDPLARTVHALVDSVPLMAFSSGWAQGTPVRVVFGIVSRDPGKPVDAEISKVSYEPFPARSKMGDFTEHFERGLLEPPGFRVLHFDGFTAVDEFGPGNPGLRVHGRALHMQATRSLVVGEHVSVLDVLGRSVELRSFRLTMKFRVNRLHQAALIMGFRNVLVDTPFGRIFDVGLIDVPGKPGPFAFSTGEWTDTGEVTRMTVPSEIATTGELRVDYDMVSRYAKGYLNGKLFNDVRSDLQPLERVHPHFGVGLEGPDAEFDVVIEEIKLDHL